MTRVSLVVFRVAICALFCTATENASKQVRTLHKARTLLQHDRSRHTRVSVERIDPAEWKQVTTVLVFQGALLSNCYKAFDAGTYEKSKQMLLQKLGAKIDVLYMTCGAGGATPEWKFLQRESGQVQRARDVGNNVSSFILTEQQRHGAKAFPCVDNPAAAGCPTKPPVMFPYTPTATLTVEIMGYHSEVQKAMQESEKADFCFDAANDVAVCTEWVSGKKCCMIAPPTQPPPQNLLTPLPYNPR